jgi:hypothetical protein
MFTVAVEYPMGDLRSAQELMVKLNAELKSAREVSAVIAEVSA